MPDFRAYAPDGKADAATITLGPEESHHLTAVNRCSRGDPVVAFDGRGREWTCACVDPARTGAVLAVKSTHQSPPLPGLITLAQGLPKGAVMDEIVRQATEIGAARIVPLLSERSQVHLDDDRARKKVGKWHVTAIEAAKQCGNPWVPEIAPVQPLADFLAAARDHDLRLIASLHAGATSLKQALAQHRAKHGQPPARAAWLVGPEGDFSPGEMTAAIQAGFAPVTLGPLVLRSDTAAVFALSILRHELM
ncbi:MAG TPA: RsmE family RNA methyltransferase [Opitutaceae bacterium]|nr:RsmE family RNA methyltransferase [Opitutaceae bacterium]